MLDMPERVCHRRQYRAAAGVQTLFSLLVHFTVAHGLQEHLPVMPIERLRVSQSEMTESPNVDERKIGQGKCINGNEHTHFTPAVTSRPQPLLLTLQKKKPQTLCILFFVFSPSCIFQAEDSCFCFWRRSPCRFESVSSSSLVVLSSRVMCST